MRCKNIFSIPILLDIHPQATEIATKYTTSVNGQCNLATETGTIICVYATSKTSSTDMEINHILLNLFVEGNAEKVLFLLSDCGPLNHTIAIAILLAMFLCDLVRGAVIS